MSGIFGESLFGVSGLGQTTPSSTHAPDMTFSLTDPDVAAMQTTPPPSGSKTGGGAAYMPPAPLMSGGKSGGGAAYMPPAPTPAVDPATYAATPTSNNTTLYVVGGVAVVGLLAVLLMSGKRRGGTVTANRGKRGRRSRLRSR
jgi:hypothetical protein